MTSKKPAFLKWSGRILLGLCLISGGVVGGAWIYLHGSLPATDGTRAAAGLVSQVTIQRDALGVPTITGVDRADVAYATGFVHAQDRYFQMDLLRRTAAGELAELLGAAALDADRQHRLHRFRARARAALQTLPEADRALLQRYADGANAGLLALSSRPFEYVMLRSMPKRWEPSDTLLVVWAMYFELQGNLEGRKIARGWLQEHSTAEEFAFLLPGASEFDAPLDAAGIKTDAARAPAHAPGWFAKPALTKVAAVDADYSVGSNNWAIAGERSRHGGAIVADDMHLSIGLPNTWYRAMLRYPGQNGETRSVMGVTLPGTPLVIAGSNGHVAWGFTNSYGDYLDLIRIERDPGNPLRFKTGKGWETAQEYSETLLVKGAAPQEVKVLETSEGPVREIDKRFYAVHWVAHEAGAVNVALRGLESVQSVGEALAVANRSGFPAQNFTAGDREGHIGWTIGGALPARDSSVSTSFPRGPDAGLDWKGLRPAVDYPRLMDPVGGQIWTANNRQLAGDAYRKIGDGGADLGARARQIRDDLAQLGKNTDEQATYLVQLDDRALFMASWRERALKALDAAAIDKQPARAEFRNLLEQNWTGHASVDSRAYRLARAFLYATYGELFSSLNADLQRLDPRAGYASANPRWPVVVARLLDERPAGWLPEGKTWHDLELAAVDLAIRQLTEGGRSLSNATWGARNTAEIRHPFASFLPVVGNWLSAPPDPLPGDEHMPRVAAYSFGQSERMVVSPGFEQNGIFNMPGGQSGNPLSPYFLAGHSNWVQAAPTPFLPGPTEHTFTLSPR